MTYTADFRHRARICLQAAGYPDRHNSLRDTARLLGVSRHTLKRWFHAAEPAPTPNVSVQPMLQHELQQLFATLDRKREDANYAQLSRALAQLVETMRQVESSP